MGNKNHLPSNRDKALEKQQQTQSEDNVDQVLQELPAAQRKKVRALIRSTEINHQYQGPIPCPEDIALYNQHIPDGANRIMIMAEEQSAHRRELESFVIKSQQKQSERGQFFGFFLGLFGLSTAACLAILGHEATAAVIGGGTVISLVSVFVIGKRQQQKDLESKKEAG